MNWKVEFHSQVYISGTDWECTEYANSISVPPHLHFVREPGLMTNRSDRLLLLGIL